MSTRGETSLTNSIVTSIAQAPVAAGTADQNGNIEDMSGEDPPITEVIRRLYESAAPPAKPEDDGEGASHA